ncbi:hypothetical protein B0I35DRAFT_511092 [Stachybotrys elegans]|uniref:BRCT domain-containing protein n=1 Tax=Stachybotrys elegans TaxID=80388 RepID=A0A8K0SUW9_9HYPO|nr:hypothetical protein B0I35DRAFT_511092 [Stachybotrys elegans]
MDSPPKRVTRSRAAAKVSEPKVKTTKIITAATKARTASTATAPTKSSAGKRKTRSDESEGEDEEQRETVVKKTTRGRPRKIVAPDEEAKPAAPAPARATRARAGRKIASEEPKQEEPAPPRATRGRPRKTEQPQESDATAAPAKKTATRTRAATVSKADGVEAKPVVKKTVTFQEPDKENFGLATAKAKEAPTTGLRGRPARRGGAAAAAAASAAGTRATRSNAKSSEKEPKKPLSPKKVTQMPVSRDADSSEDELAGPVNNLRKSPIKPRNKPAPDAEKPAPQSSQAEEDAEMALAASTITLSAPDNVTAVLGSPARRFPASPIKETMKSPARKMGAVPLPGALAKPSLDSSGQPEQSSPFKGSLLQSAAKRPQSPIKGLNFGSVPKPQFSQSAMKMSMFQSPAKRAMPGLKPVTEPRLQASSDSEDAVQSKPLEPFVLSTPTPAVSRPSEKLMAGEDIHDDEAFDGPLESLQFPGRMSAVLPRHADPTLQQEEKIDDSETEEEVLKDEPEAAQHDTPAAEMRQGDQEPEEITAPEANLDAETAQSAAEGDVAMALDEIVAEMEESIENLVAVAPKSPVKAQKSLQLREKDLDPCYDMHSDSEDDATMAIGGMSQTPLAGSKASRRSSMGFTLLAEQFDSWSAISPIKNGVAASAPQSGPVDSIIPTDNAIISQPEVSPVSNHFFEDEMINHQVAASDAVTEQQPGNLDDNEPSIESIPVTDEDMALAQEANEMSLMEPEEVEEAAGPMQSFDDSLSDASQEYGDENQVPIDPAIMGSAAPTTPIRPMMVSFHTTTKVPLKAADNSTPSPLKKRSYSASRVAPKRPNALNRSATVISYSPSKSSKTVSNEPTTPGKKASNPTTPSKSDTWSSVATPARTPRRDIDTTLLRGAVVFVDAYTSEGSDASGIFIELLEQMGARCVKSWSWSPNGSGNDSSKVGITHVVYKDGSKRTMERVREANGVVHCVGVSWVLDCERENKWLDEAAYYIDTHQMPRSVGCRRKSMEPTALAKQSGGPLFVSPVKGKKSARDVQSAPNTPMNRRDSTLWMHSPADQDEEEIDNGSEWDNSFLTPVPKTPAPEAVARYAADIPDTPSECEEESESPTKTSLLMRTCPPKQSVYHDLGENVLSKDKDEGVLMRLMAARRKSLQFAPKIASPLSKTWD